MRRKRSRGRGRGVLTVQDGLAQRHEGGAPAKQDGEAAFAAPYAAIGGLVLVPEVDIGDVHDGLNDVEGALRTGEAITGVESLPAVDMVDLAIELVGRPDGPVKAAALHG